MIAVRCWLAFLRASYDSMRDAQRNAVDPSPRVSGATSDVAGKHSDGEAEVDWEFGRGSSGLGQTRESEICGRVSVGEVGGRGGAGGKGYGSLAQFGSKGGMGEVGGG